jgi:peptidyl-prolyl cis-trans isomerase SurA
MHRVIGAILFGLSLLLVAAGPVSAASVKVTVNGTPITDVQIAQRLALMKLENRSGAQAAQDELINEALEMQEAKRLGFEISENDVDSALGQLAQQLRLSTSNLMKVLTNNGVGIATLRDRLRANLAWGKISQTAISARVTVSEADIDKEAKAKLTAANSYDYILKEVLFLTVKGGQSAAQRTAQANQYRKNFTGCANAVQLSLSYTDAAVRDVGRRHATQFPDALADELSKLNVGGLTKPRVVENGVSMFAVCSKEVSQDTSYIADNLRQTAGNGALKTEQEKYLAELKAKAQIVAN